MSAPDQTDDLTAAYFAGYHKRDDYVLKLERELERVKAEREEWKKCAGELAEVVEHFIVIQVVQTPGWLSTEEGKSCQLPLTRYNQMKGKE